MENKPVNKQTENQLAEIKKDISSQVLSKIDAFQKSGELTLPKDYNAENALKSAYIILTDPRNNILEKCNKSSVAEALLKMVIYGVSPIKKQCYFIPYGDKLECSISYAGNIAGAKRYGGLKSIKANAIFDGDEFEFEVDAITGRKKVIKHKQTLASIGSNKLKGAYAVYELNNGVIDIEIMSINQIQASWNQGGTKGNSPAHKNFPDEMAKKTVINRACKLLISSSDDSVLFDPLDENQPIDVASENVNFEIKQNANKEPLDFENTSTEIPFEEVEKMEVKAEVVNAEAVIHKGTLFAEGEKKTNEPGF